jgi:hypothetical protein
MNSSTRANCSGKHEFRTLGPTAATGPLPASFAVDGEKFERSHIYIARVERHLIVGSGRTRIARSRAAKALELEADANVIRDSIRRTDEIAARQIHKVSKDSKFSRNRQRTFVVAPWLSTQEDKNMGKGALLWLLGIPLPIVILLWLFGFLH